MPPSSFAALELLELSAPVSTQPASDLAFDEVIITWASGQECPMDGTMLRTLMTCLGYKAHLLV